MVNVTVDEIQRDPLKYLRQVEAGETLDSAVRAYPVSVI